MGEVRKLQKKLRQIENLEIKIALTPEERLKISRKAELRSRLAELLLQHFGPQQTPGIVGKGKKEKMKRQVEDTPKVVPSQTHQAPKVPRGEPEARAEGVTPQAVRGSGSGMVGGEGGGHEAEVAAGSGQGPGGTQGSPDMTHSEQQEEQEEFKLKSLRALWERAKFRLRPLAGHSDIVTCVLSVDNLVISGSRDTTVKVWHVPTATEQRNLGGHSGGITSLCAPPPEYCVRLARSLSLSEEDRFILSGSADCYVKVWALNTGQCVKSIYTFSVVTALCFVPEGDGCIVTGSDAGKLQAWSWRTLENCQSVIAHQEAVTSVQCQGPLVFTGSAEGGVSVWESSRTERDPLRLLHHWAGEATGCDGGQGGRLTLSPRGDRVFVAYGQACLRILHWRTGAVSKLTNHSSISGITDCVHQVGGLLIGSSYDLANGGSNLNIFSLPECKYLVSLTCADAPRILCFAAWRTGSGDHRWVTGGHDLIVWEQLPNSGKQRGDVIARRDSQLDTSVMESDVDTDEEESDDEDEDEEEEEYESQGEAEGESGSWLRCALQ